MSKSDPSVSSVSYMPKRSSKRSEDLMLAALNLFSKRDVATVTIKDVAAVANVNSALIYYYFDDKEHLLRSALAFAVREAVAEHHRLHEAHEHPAELIRAWFRNNLKLSEPIRQLVKIMLDYNATTERAFSIADLVDHFYLEEEQNILADNIQRGIDMGLFHAVDPGRTAHFVSVHLDGIMVASLIRTNFDLPQAINDLEEMLWDQLDYRIGSHGPARAS